MSNMIFNSHDLLYVILKIYFKKFFLNLKGLSDGKIVSITIKEYGSTERIWFYGFLSLINNSVTIEFSFLLLIVSAIISSKIINTFLFFYLDCSIQYFLNILHII